VKISINLDNFWKLPIAKKNGEPLGGVGHNIGWVTVLEGV